MSAPGIPRGPDRPGAPEVTVVLAVAFLGLGLLWLLVIELLEMARVVAGWWWGMVT